MVNPGLYTVDVQDHDGGMLLMATLFELYPPLLELFGDAGYRSSNFQQSLAQACREANIEIVRQHDAGKFAGLFKCRIMDVTIARLNRCRRRSKD